MEINFGNFFKDIDSKKEKEIYTLIYGTIAAAVISVFIAGGAGYFTARNLIEVFNSRSNSGVVSDISVKAVELKDMKTRLQMIKSQFEDIKYPDRNMLRGSINKDLSEINFMVQTFTLKDYDPASMTVASKPKGRGSADIEDTSKMPDMVEIIISGRIPEKNMMRLFTLMNRTDRFWFVNSIEIYPPDGQSEFFGKSFVMLPGFRKKEMFEMYSESLEDPNITVAFTFYTFVRGGDRAADVKTASE